MRTRLLVGLFSLSGACGLVYELVWLRLFGAFFGVTQVATSAVIAAFMGGLALGARWFAGRAERDRNPLRLYALLELGIGLTALALPRAVGLLGQGYEAMVPALGLKGPWLVALRFVLAGAVMLVPTTLMGGTLPALTQALARASAQVGRVAGHLYAANTLGAVAGVLAAGLLLLPRFGVTATHSTLAIANLAIALVAWLFSRRATELPAPAGRGQQDRAAGARAAASSRELPGPLVRRRVGTASPGRRRSDDAMLTSHLGGPLALAALSGFVALAYELTWLRVLSFVTYDSVFSFACTLSVFLLGIAGGSELCSRGLARTRVPLLWFARFQVALAIYAALCPPLFRLVDTHLAREFDTQHLAQASWLTVAVIKQLALGGALLLLPTLLMGASLPCLLRVHAERSQGVAGPTGRVYAANTWGALAGAVLTGLLLIPAWGIARSSLLAGVVGLSAALLALRLQGEDTQEGRLRSRLRPIATSCGVVLLCLAPAAHAGWFLKQLPAGQRIVFRQEDASGLVEVIQAKDGRRTLFTNRTHRWGDTSPTMLQAMRRQGYLPLMLHHKPARVLEVGLGTGVNLVPALLHPEVQRLDVVEISTGIVAAARYFDEHNQHLLDHPKLQLHVEDGRSFLRVTRRRFDVMVLGIFTPYRPNSGYLFSRELYEHCARRLAPDGLLVQWLPLNQLSPKALRTVLATFKAVFPSLHVYERAHYLAVVGSLGSGALAYSELAARFRLPSIGSDLERWNLARPEGFVAAHLLGPAEVGAFAAGAPVNSENRLAVEFSRLRLHAGSRYAQATQHLEQLLAWRTPHRSLLGTMGPQQRHRMEQAFAARGHALRGAIHEVRSQHRLALVQFAKALALDPNEEIARSEMPKYERALRTLRQRAVPSETPTRPSVPDP